MRQLALISICILSLGCENRPAPVITVPQTVVGVDLNSKEPRFVFLAPVGFEWNHERQCWYSKDIRTSIALAHATDTSFETVVDDFVADRMRASKLELISKVVRQIDGRSMLIVHAKRLSGSFPQETCTVAYATTSGCAQVTAIYPADMDQNMKARIESTLLRSRYEVPK